MISTQEMKLRQYLNKQPHRINRLWQNENS